MAKTTRREAIALGGAWFGLGLAGCSEAQTPPTIKAPVPEDDLFSISLAQWSLHRALYSDSGSAGHLNPAHFAVKARRDFDIGAVEYVNTFYRDKVRDEAYVQELKTIADGEGVKSLLIMCDGEGRLGDSDAAGRTQAIENHHKWADMAAQLGCHALRVNAHSDGSYDEQQKLAADGLQRLAEYTRQYDISVIVENHGGWSSHGAWLAGVMALADNAFVGTLPDFGNFGYAEGKSYDPYQGVEELMPYAKGVSAKSFSFDRDGNEQRFDYNRFLRIVLDSGFRGHVGVEFEGGDISESDGIRKTKALLEREREVLRASYQ